MCVLHLTTKQFIDNEEPVLMVLEKRALNGLSIVFVSNKLCFVVVLFVYKYFIYLISYIHKCPQIPRLRKSVFRIIWYSEKWGFN